MDKEVSKKKVSEIIERGNKIASDKTYKRGDNIVVSSMFLTNKFIAMRSKPNYHIMKVKEWLKNGKQDVFGIDAEELLTQLLSNEIDKAIKETAEEMRNKNFNEKWIIKNILGQ